MERKGIEQRRGVGMEGDRARRGPVRLIIEIVQSKIICFQDSMFGFVQYARITE